MSRSYKKTPICKDYDSGVIGKRFASKSIRRYKNEISNGKEYKKLYCSWNIHDYVSRYTYEECLEEYLRDYPNATEEELKELYLKWASSYLRK